MTWDFSQRNRSRACCWIVLRTHTLTIGDCVHIQSQVGPKSYQMGKNWCHHRGTPVQSVHGESEWLKQCHNAQQKIPPEISTGCSLCTNTHGSYTTCIPDVNTNDETTNTSGLPNTKTTTGNPSIPPNPTSSTTSPTAGCATNGHIPRA